MAHCPGIFSNSRILETFRNGDALPAMMGMKKIDLATVQKGYRGE